MTLKPEISNELRSMVREALRDVMAQRTGASLAAVESVRLANDQDLAAFVSRLMDPAVQERVKSGRLRFTLGVNPAQEAAAAASTPLTGVVTEKTIDRIAGTGSLILGPGAVLTPLARDRARQLGLKLERRS
ncbi:MAG TPA: hypothetical protein P5337_09015 [Aestuariivirga sp.]|nr:hypothetical protein [Aestuariivirga sp.]